MVQTASTSEALSPEDYLWPLTTIRNTLTDPDPTSTPSPKLRGLLRYHLPRLKTPWSPFAPASSSSKLGNTSATIPGTTSQVTYDDSTRSLAVKLSERIGVDAVECVLLCKSYDAYSLDEPEEGQKLERLVMWYAEEVEAAPGIVLALLRLSRILGDNPWAELADAFRVDLVGDLAKCVEGLFRAWGTLAQKPLEAERRSHDALFWATHQLQLQDALLQVLFLLLYQSSDRPSSISEGLIRGSIMSMFGTSQSNRDVWDSDSDCQRLAIRIRDQVLIIAIEAMCLTSIISPQEETPKITLLTDRNGIFNTHLFLLEHSEDLVESPESGWEFPMSPIAVVCLGWAIALRSLPPALAPAAAGLEDGHREFLQRALRIPSGLFPWLEEILAGPLFSAKETSVGDGSREPVTFRRKVIKDLLMGLVEATPLDRIQDRNGLYRTWELLFGGGSPSTSTALCADYWVVDIPTPSRLHVLSHAGFPAQPAHLPLALSSLGSSTDNAETTYGTSPPKKVLEYFSALPTVTLQVQPRWYRFVGKDESGRMTVEAAKELVLPGGEAILIGRSGTVISREDAPHIAQWEVQISGWSLLVEILRTAAGLRPIDEKDGQSSDDVVYLSVGDLGVQASASETLSAGLKLLASTLSSSISIASSVLFSIRSDQTPILRIMELAIAVLANTTDQPSKADTSAATSATDILSALVDSPDIWLALRASSFFGVAGKRKGIVSSLIQIDAASSDHSICFALTRLVSRLCVASQNTESDEVVMRGAIHTVFSDIWLSFAGWRYADSTEKCKLASGSIEVFETILRHPYARGTEFSPASKAAVDAFITSTSASAYRPLVDMIAQGPMQVQRLVAAQRGAEARVVTKAIEDSLSLMGTSLRIAFALQTSPTSLPKAAFSLPGPGHTQIHLADLLFHLASSPSSQDSIVVATLKLLRTWLESISQAEQKLSLASTLTDAASTCHKLAVLAATEESPDQQAAAWDLLATIISTQPGCAPFCIDSNGSELDGTLKLATAQISTWDQTIRELPQPISAVLSYINSVILCPSASDAVSLLRKDAALWQSIYDVAVWHVPTPPTFTLSLHAEDFAPRLTTYAYATQAKANAVSVLSAEIASSLELEDGETRAQSLVLGLWRNAAKLQELCAAGVHNSAKPELHEAESSRLQSFGISLARLKTIKLAAERSYGHQYLYGKLSLTALIIDREPRIPDSFEQSSINLAVDMLNLNWSMLDADIAFTKALRTLGETISILTEGDRLAAVSSLKAAVAIAETLSKEDRGGDVMLAVQVERLAVLEMLLHTALDPASEPDTTTLSSLIAPIRGILESNAFPPISSLRHPDLPPIHKPVLRILYYLVQALQLGSLANPQVDTLLEIGTVFVLESADVVLDYLIRGAGHPADLGLVVATMCEITKSTSTAWFDKLSESNLIVRSLELLVRSKLSHGLVPIYLPAILLLHLSLANHPKSAEKLAVSGIMPAYSDNVIASQAESGRIDPIAGAYTVHTAWCGYLLVVKALLANLPNTSSFVRSDVVPFLRVTSSQLSRAISWDGATPIGVPAMQETELVLELYHAVAIALGSGHTTPLLEEFASPAMDLLKSIRHALSHPRVFSTLVIPSSEEEQSALEKELVFINEDENVDLVNFDKTPILAERVYTLLRLLRTALLALVALTNAFGLLQGDEPDDPLDALLETDDSSTSTSDSVAILNDLSALIAGIAEKLSINTTESGTAFRVCGQIAESAAVLAASQLVLRRSMLPDDGNYGHDEDRMDVDEKDRKKRISLTGDRAFAVLRELEADLRGTLASENAVGDRGMYRWIEGFLDGVFGVVE